MLRTLILLLISTLASHALALESAAPSDATYRVRQTVTLDQIADGARSVVWWVSIPDDNPHQEILDVAVVSAPGVWSIVREKERGNRFLFVEAKPEGKRSLDTVVEFTLRRRAIHVNPDPARTGRLESSQAPLFREYLRRDAPHMEVTPEIQKLADETCGSEANIVRQATRIVARVAALADHYSKDPSKPSCGVGDAGACLEKGGGCCTDLHSLFIAMARARGIPARLQMGYRLLGRNAGKEVDPGYRCWIEYFAPGYGWVPSDIVEADDPKGLGLELWSSGLTVERLWLNEGREILLGSGDHTRRANHMSIGYAEIDGTPARVLPEGELAPQLSRRVRFDVIRPDGTTALFAARDGK